MLSNLVSMLTKSLGSTTQTPTVTKTAQKEYNPFALEDKKNPFLGTSFGSSSTYGKNCPVEGGYFAGYYNGKPNIVGRKLFIII